MLPIKKKKRKPKYYLQTYNWSRV